jgi:cell division protease FtsH
MEKLFHMAVVLAAGATTVYLMTKAQLSARGNALVDDEIDEVAPRDVTDVEESEEDADMLSTYWAGAIPEDCEEILDMLRFPEVYASYGSKMPRGLLLYGEPGTGKTYFGKMLADLANAHFFYAAASQMDEIYVGSGPKKIRALFEKAKRAASEGKTGKVKNNGLFSIFSREDSEGGDVDAMEVKRGKERAGRTKSIIFLDELDSLGVRDEFRHSDARHATLSQLLACMDGIIESDDVFVVAATNYLDGIDSALTRSGRFDRMIKMGLPSRDSRLAILQFYLKKKPGGKRLLSSSVLPLLADITAGFNSADVSTTVNEATLRATRDTVAYLKKRRLKASSSSEVPSADPHTELTEQHLLDAFYAMHTKISKERPRPELLRRAQIEDQVRSFTRRVMLSTAPPQD